MGRQSLDGFVNARLFQKINLRALTEMVNALFLKNDEKWSKRGLINAQFTSKTRKKVKERLHQ